MNEQVSVVGGGIVGLTTGIFLSLKGYETRIYTRELPYEDDPVPSVATNYAAASVKPVLVDESDMGELTRVSDRFFGRIEDKTGAVRRQKHFEVYEGDNAEPEPADVDALRSYRSLDEYGGRVPKSEGVDRENLAGYVHEIFFVEMPRYVPLLVRWYRATGGDLERREVGRDEIGGLNGDVVVNATGNGNLFDDDRLVAMRGHLVHADTDRRVVDNGDDFSYTYHLDDRFVYAYPRDDALVLGGSAQKGEIVDGEWAPSSDDETADETVTVNGVDVPRRITETNRGILRGYGVDLDRLEKTAGFGYRPYRRGGVRMEKEVVDGKEVVHCYGHGGAGVTLSWLSANRVYNLVSGSSGYDYTAVDEVASLDV